MYQTNQEVSSEIAIFMTKSLAQTYSHFFFII